MAEMLVRSLIRLIVTVAVLVAAYLLILRPILDTTESTFDQAFGGVQSSINDAFEGVGIDPPKLTGDSKSDAQKLLACIQRAQPNKARMTRCADRFTK